MAGGMLRRRGCRVALSLALTLGAAGSSPAGPAAAPPAWVEWSDDTFARAKREHKLVLLSLQSWWCPWCHTMNETTYGDPEVREVIAGHFIAVRVDQDSRPDLSQRYERWGWPATVIFGPDGTEIVKLRGFYSPKFFLPILRETIRDPSPVDYGKLGGDERAAAQTTRLPEQDRREILAFIDKSWDGAHGGFGPQKLADGPTYTWLLERAYLGDGHAAARARRTIDGVIRLIDRETGAVSQVTLARDYSRPAKEHPMFAQEGALKGLAHAYALWREPRHLIAARRVVAFLANTMRGPNGGFYSSFGRERGNPGVDRRQYARENGLAIQGLLAYHDATGETRALDLARGAARWALANRARGDGGFNHAERDAAGPYLGDALAMGQALLALHRSTGEREWLTHARAAGDFILRTFVDPGTGALVASASPDAAHLTAPIKQKDDNAAAVRFLNLLAAYTGEGRFRQAAESVFGYLASPAVLEAYGFLPDVLHAEYELTHEPVHVTVIGGKDDPRAQALYRAALRYPSAHKRAEWWDRREGTLPNPDVAYPEHPQAAVFACTSTFCSLPVTDPTRVAPALDRLQRALR